MKEKLKTIWADEQAKWLFAAVLLLLSYAAWILCAVAASSFVAIVPGMGFTAVVLVSAWYVWRLCLWHADTQDEAEVDLWWEEPRDKGGG